jgi:excisionase family DNA binding protein
MHTARPLAALVCGLDEIGQAERGRDERYDSMSVTDLRKDLEHIRASAQAGDLQEVVQAVDHALQSLDGSRLLTTTEAAEVLGIRSVNTLKALVIRNGIPYERRGNRMMLPLAEVERLRETPLLRGLRASEALHETIADLGPADGEGLTAEELQDLEATRPGRLPWQRPAEREAQHRAEKGDPRSQCGRDAGHA